MHTYKIEIHCNGGRISGDVWVDFDGSEMTYDATDPKSQTGAPMSVKAILDVIGTDIEANEWRPAGSPA